MVLLILIFTLLNCKTISSELDYHPIRIKVYYKYLEHEASNFHLYKHLLKTAAKYIEDTYSVKRSQNSLKLSQHKCHHTRIPKKHQKKGIKNKDFMLYVTETYENDSWIAKSEPCAFDVEHRPIAGEITLNRRYFNNLKNRQRYERLGTIVHEFTHTLGFNRGVMNYFNMTEMIDSKLFIKSKEIIAYAQEYYHCSTLKNLPLEDGGGKSAMYSHFEKMTFNQEIMTGTASRDTVYSKFTMLALQDTGLYKANLDTAGRYEWGMGKGCSATQGECNSPTICSANKRDRFCSYDYQHISFCKANQKLAECGLSTALKDCNKKKCFNIGVSSAKCLKSKCTNQGILVKFGGQQKYCTSDVINFGDTSIKCPVFENFCNKYSLCNNRGEIRNGKCYCYLGYRGKKCQKTI